MFNISVLFDNMLNQIKSNQIKSNQIKSKCLNYWMFNKV